MARRYITPQEAEVGVISNLEEALKRGASRTNVIRDESGPLAFVASATEAFAPGPVKKKKKKTDKSGLRDTIDEQPGDTIDEQPAGMGPRSISMQDSQPNQPSLSRHRSSPESLKSSTPMQASKLSPRGTGSTISRTDTGSLSRSSAIGLSNTQRSLDAPLQKLLQEQFRTVERALAFNLMIAERLAREDVPIASESTSKDAASIRKEKVEELLKEDVPISSSIDTVRTLSTQGFAENDIDESSDDALQDSGLEDSAILRTSARFKSETEHDDSHALTESARQPSARYAVPPGGIQEDCHDLRKPLLTPEATPFMKKESTPLQTKGTASFRAKDGKENLSGHMFPTMGSWMQMHIVKTLEQKAPEVEDYYQESGICVRIATNSKFNNLTLLVILVNAIWISIDTDCNKADTLADAEWPFQVMAHFFCGFFTFEMVVRWFAYRSTYFAISDAWFMFDLVLVTLMVWETWIAPVMTDLGLEKQKHGGSPSSVLRIFRLFRLLRVARTARLFNSVPELMILVKGMVVALRSVAVILCMLSLLIYIFAIVFTQLLAGTPVSQTNAGIFETVPSTMNYLLLSVLCGFDADLFAQVLEESVLCFLCLHVFMLLASLIIMNMLIGILCDVVFTIAEDEKEETFQRDMEHKVEKLAASLDVNGNGFVSSVEFAEVFHRPDVIMMLNDLGVDVAGLMDFAHFVYQENDDLSYAHFLHMVVQFRGGKPATVKDVMAMRKQISMQLRKLHEDFITNRSRSYSEILDSVDMDKWGAWAERADERKEGEQAASPIKPDTFVTQLSPESDTQLSPGVDDAVEEVVHRAKSDLEARKGVEVHREATPLSAPDQPVNLSRPISSTPRPTYTSRPPLVVGNPEHRLSSSLPASPTIAMVTTKARSVSPSAPSITTASRSVSQQSITTATPRGILPATPMTGTPRGTTPTLPVRRIEVVPQNSLSRSRTQEVREAAQSVIRSA